MKNLSKKKQDRAVQKVIKSNDKTKPDRDGDKSGTDKDSDKTEPTKGKNRFDKPKREVDPDQTGIDIVPTKIKKNSKSIETPAKKSTQNSFKK